MLYGRTTDPIGFHKNWTGFVRFMPKTAELQGQRVPTTQIFKGTSLGLSAGAGCLKSSWATGNKPNSTKINSWHQKRQLIHRNSLFHAAQLFKGLSGQLTLPKKAPLNSWTMGAGCPHGSAVSDLLVAFVLYGPPWTALKVHGGLLPGCSHELGKIHQEVHEPIRAHPKVKEKRYIGKFS